MLCGIEYVLLFKRLIDLSICKVFFIEYIWIMLIQLLVPYPLTSSSAQFYVHSFFSSVSKQSQKPNAAHNNEDQSQNNPKTYKTINNNNKKNAPAKQNKESKKKKEKS